MVRWGLGLVRRYGWSDGRLCLGKLNYRDGVVVGLGLIKSMGGLFGALAGAAKY